jgi:uncharacterized protein (DUF1697 family)
MSNQPLFRFVAFLRGINVGGHIAKKDQLQEAFAALGFRDVSTFKQSGNIIFTADIQDTENIRTQIETKLRQTLGFNVPVFIRTIPQLMQLLELDPFKGQNEKDIDFQVTFLANVPKQFPLKLPLRIPSSTADIISVCGTEVFSVTRGGGDGGKPNPFLESKLKVQATTRNWNIIKAIVEKYREPK